MIRILVDDDVVRVPIPAVNVRDLPRSHAPVPVAEAETAGIATLKSPMMLGTEAAIEAPMLPWTILVKTPVVAALVMAYPHASVINVRGVGMVRLVAVIAVLLGWSLLGRSLLAVIAVLLVRSLVAVIAVLLGCSLVSVIWLRSPLRR